MKRVDERRKGKHYKDKDAAMVLRGTSMKRTLPETLFMLILEYGVNLFGYWYYDNMIDIFEDCIDVFHKL